MSATSVIQRGYTYFDHQADVGIEGFGASLEESFEEAAAAMFNLIVDISRVEPNVEVTIECQGADREEILVEWLNALLAQADIHNVAFSRFKILHLTDRQLSGIAMGEELDQRKHRPKLEVKAATYSMLAVEHTGGRWSARCVVDV